MGIALLNLDFLHRPRQLILRSNWRLWYSESPPTRWIDKHKRIIRYEFREITWQQVSAKHQNRARSSFRVQRLFCFEFNCYRTLQTWGIFLQAKQMFVNTSVIFLSIKFLYCFHIHKRLAESWNIDIHYFI